MKRKLFAAAMICAALMVGCEKPQPEEPDKKPDTPLEPEKPDKPDQPENPDEQTWQMTDVELTGEIEAIGTKTSFTDGKVAWKAGDKISVFYTAEGKSETAEFTSAAEGTSAKFTGKLNLLIDPKKPTEIPAVEKWAVYPAATAAAFDGAAFTVTVPATQTAQEGSFAAESCWPLVAKSGDDKLSFSAVCGGLSVTFQRADVTSFTLKATGGEKIAGAASVTLGTDGKPAATPDAAAVSEIKVNAPAGGFAVGQTYYVTALPATLANGYTVSLSGGETVVCETSTEIVRDAFTAITIEDRPQVDPYETLKAAFKPLTWWESEMPYLGTPMPAYTKTDKEYDRTQWKYNLSNIRFSSDLDYIYGYIESKGDEDLSMFKNLGVWLDVDGDQNGTQGGGWMFTLHKFFDLSIYGEISTEGNLTWTPGLRTQTAADGEKYGSEKATDSPAAYGEGSFSGNVFKYSFIIDRKVVGLGDATKAVVGINFDNGNGIAGANLTNPDRGGYKLNLRNADSPEFDETAILRKVRSVDEWGSVEYASITNNGNNRGDTRLKFDSDADYIYGYIEVPNTDNLYFKNGEYYEFCPGFIKRLAIGIDLDGVETGQGIGWPIGTCWETVLNGTIISCRRPLSDEDKALGWQDRWGHYIFPSDKFDPATITRPTYTITPEVWTPTLNDASAAEGFGTVKVGTEDWQYFATGKGEWKDKCFRYSFAIERSRLGLKGLAEVKLGVFMYEDGVSGYSNTPDAVGTTIKLNN